MFNFAECFLNFDFMKNISTPHDKYFKELFSKHEIMLDFLNGALPHIAKHLELDTLEIDKTDYIDEELHNIFSDLVYNCKYKTYFSVKIALLFEHKSYVPEQPYLQLLGYMLKIWETNVKQKQKLTPVIPILFYHGKDVEWNKKNFDEYFEQMDDFLRRYLPKFDFEVVNIASLSDSQIKEISHQLSLRAGLLMMKHIFDSPMLLLDKLIEIFSDLQKILETEMGKNFFKTTVIYLFHTSKLDFDKVQEKMYDISLEVGEEFGTIAYQLNQRGKKEAKKEAKFEVARNLKNLKISFEMISQATGLTIQEIGNL